MAWGKAGSDTLTTTANTVSVTGISANDTLQTMSHITKSSSGNYGIYARYNDVSSGSLYHGRYETNGTTDQTYQANQLYYMLDNGGGTAISAGDFFNVSYTVNIATEEKLTIGFTNLASGTGAGTTPKRNWFIARFDNTSDQITSVKHFDEYATQYGTGSNLSVLGSDITPASAIPFPENVELGSRAEITDTRKIYYRMDSDYETDKWFELGTVPYAGGRGVFAGGNGSNVMDYITIATTGNATDFGDLSYARGISANNPSNGTRGVYGGSNSSTSLDYITISTLGNSTTFGNNTQARNWNCGLDDQTTRGVYGGGDLGATVTNVMDYITIATTGNATDFGDLSASRSASGCVSTTTRGVFTGGTTASANTNIIDYITISTTGNATNFGNCTTGNAGGGGVDNNTRGVFWLGYDGSAPYEIINYITIATTGNATDFGDLITAGYGSGAVDNKTRGVKAGGSGAGDAMEYFSIATTGNATDFGNLTTTSRFMTGGVD